MTIRRAHGAAARCGSISVVEQTPAGEQPHGIARPVPVDTGEGRNRKGQYLPGTRAAQENARAGGRAKAGWSRLANSIGRSAIPADPSWAPYASDARSLAKRELEHLRRNVGNGVVGPGVRAAIQRAALAFASAAWHSDTAASLVHKDPKLASQMFATGQRLADSAKSALLFAHDLAVKQAPKTAPGVTDVNALLPPKRTE